MALSFDLQWSSLSTGKRRRGLLTRDHQHALVYLFAVTENINNFFKFSHPSSFKVMMASSEWLVSLSIIILH